MSRGYPLELVLQDELLVEDLHRVVVPADRVRAHEDLREVAFADDALDEVELSELREDAEALQ